MTRSTGGIFTVFCEHLANRGGPANVGLDRRHVGWRGRDVEAQEPLRNPNAAEHRRGIGAVGGNFQDGPLGEHATSTVGVCGKTHGADRIARHALDVVVTGQAAVEVRLVGLHQAADIEVVCKHRSQVGMGFSQHRLLHDLIKIAKSPSVGLREVDQGEVEPFASKVFHKLAAAGVSQHAVHFPANNVRVTETALCGKREQGFVGHGVPEEVTQPRGECIVVKRARLLLEVEKPW